MSIQFLWEERFSVGDPVLDQQHIDLFRLANQVSQISDLKEVRPIIMRLYKYVRQHFSYEEAMMKSIGFPLLEEHKVLHNNLISTLNEVSLQTFDDEDKVYKFRKFVYDWLVDHVMNEDNKYFQFSKELDIQYNPPEK
ncbi:MAG: hemerythrin family protein [Desulfobacterales bacterium]|nr:hemerythrin family protein [Desulfobacterales bacterium]